ncbi:hypothetical protein SAMN04487970_1001327 [Paenibacillus tianmuensis]|uniref:DUF309 domain-containing protein n=1 Tax=Paenibacillus tianmuensis TaxID=624147 RepID=A0A1G4P9X3_9BACL|nr:DUF309 domain-containing protein [Paenibacillus tianmuensis]SCW29087.1 hypothetical protein SAMN04487970_1001327 [Paenibacillus tianmuensis]
MPNYTEAYIQYLVHFHAERDFFECHEVMEEYWKEHPEDPCSEACVGLIQVAVSLYHQRRGNRAGAVKMLASSLRRLKDEQLEQLGIDAAEFRLRLQARLRELEQVGFVYTDLDIPLQDEALNVLCRDAAAQAQVEWGQPSNLNDTYLIHKHTLRDRSDVVAEREMQKQLRMERRTMGDGV